MQLTEHFTLEEFETSRLAKRLNIKNRVPDFTTAHNLYSLCFLLEKIRKYIGKPIVITSGYRCPELNKAVGGVSNSQHMLGEACDFIICYPYSSKDVYSDIFTYLLEDSTFIDQCILYEKKDGGNFIHLSSVEKSRCRHEYFKYVETEKGFSKIPFSISSFCF